MPWTFNPSTCRVVIYDSVNWPFSSRKMTLKRSASLLLANVASVRIALKFPTVCLLSSRSFRKAVYVCGETARSVVLSEPNVHSPEELEASDVTKTLHKDVTYCTSRRYRYVTETLHIEVTDYTFRCYL